MENVLFLFRDLLFKTFVLRLVLTVEASQKEGFISIQSLRILVIILERFGKGNSKFIAPSRFFYILRFYKKLCKVDGYGDQCRAILL